MSSYGCLAHENRSLNSIPVSGGQTTVANLFYNMASKTVGLVGMWDVVAFDEVAGITFKDKDGVQIMKDYMASGSFARGREEKAASASMAFVGNINQSVDVLLKTSHLFEPFPEAMAYDTAFLDRMHCYVPGWEIPNIGRISLLTIMVLLPITYRSTCGKCAKNPSVMRLTSIFVWAAI